MAYVWVNTSSENMVKNKTHKYPKYIMISQMLTRPWGCWLLALGSIHVLSLVKTLMCLTRIYTKTMLVCTVIEI